MNKELHLNDKVTLVDKTVGFHKTKVIFRNHETGEIIWEGCNKVILPGAEFLALSLFDITDSPVTPSYNTELNLDNTIYSTPMDTNKAYLFCVGTDGCGRENSQVYEVDYRQWIMPDAIVPFQYVKLNRDLTSALREIYFGRLTLSNYYAYYFKAFDSTPTLTRQWSDGNAIDATVYTTSQSVSIPVETYVTIQLSITKDDCRDYFIETTGINDARINTLSICTAWKKKIGEYYYYQDIRPVTKLNFPNEPLIDLRKGMDITYQIYF